MTDIDIEKITKMARSNLTPTEKARLGADFVQMIEYFNKLNEVDVTGVESTVHPVSERNLYREDVVTKGLSTKEATEQAPQLFDGRFQVPPAIETEEK